MAATPRGGDLYDAQRWELAYRELHDAPNLLVKLQDDLSQSRQREAFWISVVVHLVVVLLIVNSERLQRLLPAHHVVVVAPNDWTNQKELTYMELPPDAQKLTKRPNTNTISDKNRIATSKSPQLDAKELHKILDSSRPGTAGQNTPSGQQPSPSSPPVEQNQAPQQAKPEQFVPAPRPPANPDQVAKLQAPPTGPKPSFTETMSAGSAIEQAARAAIANRGAGYGGDGGDYGLGQGRQAAKEVGALEVLSDTMGVDFGPYLQRVLHDVRENWYRVIPESARAPLMKKGKVAIEFAILKDGRVAGMTLAGPSGDVALDRAAWAGITQSNPFPPLPTEFTGQYLALRFRFFYNPDSNDLE
jgi:TonB family protein